MAKEQISLTFEQWLNEGKQWLLSNDLEQLEANYGKAFKIAYYKHDEQQQIQSLLPLATIYYHYKRHAQSSALFNYIRTLCCHQIKIAQQQGKEIPAFFIEHLNFAEMSIKYVEENLIFSLGVSLDRNNVPYPVFYKKYHELLENLRTESRQQLARIDHVYNPMTKMDDTEREPIYRSRAKAIRTLYAHNNDSIKKILREIISECIELLDKPPCDYAVIGFGSLARGETTPYSDVECGILIKDEQFYDYFFKLTSLLQLKIINLGETILPALAIPFLNNFYSPDPQDKWFYDSITTRGVSLDGLMPHACKWPLGRPARYDRNGHLLQKAFILIHTPDQMVKLHFEEGYETALHISSTLSTVTLIDGNENLVYAYQEQLYDAYNCPSSTFPTLTRKKAAAITELQDIIVRYNPKLGDQLQEGKPYEVKKEIYRLPSLILEALNHFYDLGKHNPWECIDVLQQKKIISQEAAENLKVAVSIATEMRLRTYLENQGQKEKMAILQPLPIAEEKKEVSAELLASTFNIPHPEIMYRYYYSVIPFYKQVQELCHIVTTMEGGNNLPFTSSDLLDQTFKTRGIICNRFMRYNEAIAHFEQVLRQPGVLTIEGTSCDFEALLLSGLAYQSGGLEGQAAYCAFPYAERIILEKLNYRPPETASQEEKENYKYNWLQLADLYTKIGCAKERCMDSRAEVLSYLKAAKAIYKSEKLTDHPYYAENLSRLGTIYYKYERYKAAERCLSEAAIQKEKIFGKDAVESVSVLIAIGETYLALNRYKEAETFIQNAHRICVNYYGAIHPKTAATLRVFANIYSKMEMPEKSIHFLREAMISGANHNDYGAIVIDMAQQYGKQGNQQKKREYLAQAQKQYSLKYLINERLKKMEGDSYAAEGNLLEAVSCYQQVWKRLIELDNSSKYEVSVDIIDTLAALSLCYTQLGNQETQHFYLKELLKNSQDTNHLLYYHHSQKLFFDKKIQQELDFHQNLNLHPMHLAHYLIICHGFNKEIAVENLNSFKDDIIIYPTAISWSLLGYSYQHLQQYDKAVDAFNMAKDIYEQMHKGNLYDLAKKNRAICLSRFPLTEKQYSSFAI